MCFEYDDSADIFNSTQVKCRKPHRCRGCRRMIQKGERAECCSGLFDGGWFRYYVCDRCQRTVMAIAVKELKEGCPWHTAWIAVEELQEYQSDLKRHGEQVQPLQMETIEKCREHVDEVYGEVKIKARTGGILR